MEAFTQTKTKQRIGISFTFQQKFQRPKKLFWSVKQHGECKGRVWSICRGSYTSFTDLWVLQQSKRRQIVSVMCKDPAKSISFLNPLAWRWKAGQSQWIKSQWIKSHWNTLSSEFFEIFPEIHVIMNFILLIVWFLFFYYDLFIFPSDFFFNTNMYT